MSLPESGGLDAKRQRVDALLSAICRELDRVPERPVRIMEVCGTHTMSIFRHGLRHLLPQGIELISGPGCPVCVTSRGQIDTAIALSQLPGVTVATFGDMLRVPGSSGFSLAKARASGADVRIVYSPFDALQLAVKESWRKICFLGIGFETTAPVVAATIEMAARMGLENFFVFSCHKTMPNALRALFAAGGSRVEALLCPGHVSAIIGCSPYRFLPEEHGVACAIAGFEPDDILVGILSLLRQLASGRPKVDNCYPRAVNSQGNPRALASMDRVFRLADSDWRGLGLIPESGLSIRQGFEQFDAGRRFSLQVEEPDSVSPCRCDEIITGRSTPLECPLFSRACTPASPYGPCMVSSEGACAAWYRYGGQRI